MIKLWFLIFCLSVILLSCKNDKFKPVLIAPVAVTCGDLTHVSFANKVQPIIVANCSGSPNSCHDATAGIKLNNYENILAFAQSGQLVGCLSGDQNYQQMPPTGSLDSCDVKAVKNWVQQGMLNN